jgi:hypothetical protein
MYGPWFWTITDPDFKPSVGKRWRISRFGGSPVGSEFPQTREAEKEGRANMEKRGPDRNWRIWKGDPL